MEGKLLRNGRQVYFAYLVLSATVDGIGCIVDHLPRILEYAPSIPGGRSSLADRAVDLAFREIIDFLVAIASYFSQRSESVSLAGVLRILMFPRIQADYVQLRIDIANQVREGFIG